MTRRVLSLALAGSIALTSIGLAAAPARADHDDTAKVLLGAAALFLLLNHANKADNNEPTYGHKALPRRCRSVIRTHRGTARVYSRSCLESTLSNASVRKLPGKCKTSIRTNHGWRTVYQERCLRRFGWRTT